MASSSSYASQNTQESLRGWTLDEIHRLVSWMRNNRDHLRGKQSEWHKIVAEGEFKNEAHVTREKVRNKIHNMKKAWKAAKAIQQRSGWGLTENEVEKSATERLNKKCPYFWELDELWGGEPGVLPVYTTDSMQRPSLEPPEEVPMSEVAGYLSPSDQLTSVLLLNQAPPPNQAAPTSERAAGTIRSFEPAPVPPSRAAPAPEIRQTALLAPSAVASPATSAISSAIESPTETSNTRASRIAMPCQTSTTAPGLGTLKRKRGFDLLIETLKEIKREDRKKEIQMHKERLLTEERIAKLKREETIAVEKERILSQERMAQRQLESQERIARMNQSAVTAIVGAFQAQTQALLQSSRHPPSPSHSSSSFNPR